MESPLVPPAVPQACEPALQHWARTGQVSCGVSHGHIHGVHFLVVRGVGLRVVCHHRNMYGCSSGLTCITSLCLQQLPAHPRCTLISNHPVLPHRRSPRGRIKFQQPLPWDGACSFLHLLQLRGGSTPKLAASVLWRAVRKPRGWQPAASGRDICTLPSCHRGLDQEPWDVGSQGEAVADLVNFCSLLSTRSSCSAQELLTW